MLTLPEYRTALTTLSSRALAEVRALLLALDGHSPGEVRDVLILALPEVLGPYMVGAGQLAATWFEDLRRDAGLPVRYAQTAGDILPAGRVGALARWAVTPLFDGNEAVTVESLLSGGAQRIVWGAARETIAENVSRDAQSIGFARSARPGCCAFCSMLASRGTEYGEHDEGKLHYHDHCHCVAVPIFAGSAMAQAMDAEMEAHLERYQQAASLLPPGAPRTQKAMLAAMRQEHGIA